MDEEIYRLGLLEARRFVIKRKVKLRNPSLTSGSHSVKNSIVSLALEILACVLMHNNPHLVVGSDTLDVKSINNTKFKMHGRFPVPTILDYQIDTLYIRHMQRQIKELTKGLKRLIFASRNTKNWYEIFLTMFVLLVTLEKLYVHQLRYSLSHTGNVGITLQVKVCNGWGPEELTVLRMKTSMQE